MSKKVRNIIFLIVAIPVLYYLHDFIYVMKNGYTTKFITYRQYLPFFKDSTQSNIDTTFSWSEVKKTNTLFQCRYNYKHSSSFVMIWEFKELKGCNLNKIRFNQNVNFDNLKMIPCQTLETDSTPLTTAKLNFHLGYGLTIDFGGGTKIIQAISSDNYRGFYGDIDKMCFDDENGNPCILFQNGIQYRPTLFLLYENSQGFYLILFNSYKPFDASIINIFNLSQR